MILKSLTILVHILFKWLSKATGEAYILSIYFPTHFMGGEGNGDTYSSNLSPLIFFIEIREDF